MFQVEFRFETIKTCNFTHTQNETPAKQNKTLRLMETKLT